jgi:hypothetical protein
MLLISHIIIALLSLGFSGAALIKPSNFKLKASYLLVALTLTTGTVLVLSRSANLAKSCGEGLVYLGVVSALIVAAKYKLGKVEVKTTDKI